jgi:hypothetical protein
MYVDTERNPVRKFSFWLVFLTRKESLWALGCVRVSLDNCRVKFYSGLTSIFSP